MRNFGSVQTYNPLTGTGFICPDDGGELLPFRQIDVRRNVKEGVEERQRFTFDVDIDGEGEKQAINLDPA